MAGAVILPDLADPDLVMMSLALKYLPDIALVLFMGALVSALLSSADSALLAPASVIGWDLLRYFKPDAEERSSLRVTRLSVLLLGALSLLLALRTASVYDLMVDSWSVLLASLFVPLTAGLVVVQEQRPRSLSLHRGRPVRLAGVADAPRGFASRPSGRALFRPRLDNRQLANSKESPAAALTRC